MRFIIAGFLIKIFILQESLQLDMSRRKESSDLFDAASDIISSNFAWKTEAINFIIALSNATKHEWNVLINDFVVRNSDSAVVYVEEANFVYKRKRFYNILIVDSYKSFQLISEKISTDSFVIDGFYLMICIKGINLAEIEMMSKVLWNIFVYNVDYLVTDDAKKVNLLTFIPFSKCEKDTCQENEYCGNIKPTIINQYVNGSFQSRDNHYPEKITNLHQCPVKIVTFNCPPMMLIDYTGNDNNKKFKLNGVDGKMIETLADELNFTIDLFHISDSIRYKLKLIKILLLTTCIFHSFTDNGNLYFLLDGVH